MSWYRDAGIAVSTGGLGYAADKLGIFKKKTIEEPIEIRQARQKLGDFAQTGTYGDFTAGEDIGIGYGDYSTTDAEKTGLSTLQSLLSGGIPDQYKLGDSALQDLLQTSPDAIEKQFQPFNTITDRNTQDALTAQKRAAAFGGGLYSSRTIKGLGDINAKANETKMSKLADLTNEYQNRKLQAIPLAYQSAQAQQQDAINRVDASQRYGSLTRTLNNQSVTERNAEILRRRQELQLPIQAASNVMGANWTPTVSSSPYSDLLKLVGTGVGAYFGGPAGASAGNAAGSYLGSI